MPSLSWMPKVRTLREQIEEEILKSEVKRQTPWLSPSVELPSTLPSVPESEKLAAPSWLGTTEVTQPDWIISPLNKEPSPLIMPPSLLPSPPLKEEKPLVIPFWQRALQAFVAPFEWVDETIIRPGLALTSTTMGFVPDVEREPGEDFWDWKKRAWAGWEASGININVPWRKEPWRVDMKGVLELAPWLLIPGAGTVGGVAKPAIGLAGLLAKAGKAGRIAGAMIEYSPWGLAEKTAGAAIKGGFRAAGAVSERLSTAVSEKLYGKYVPLPVPPEVAELTQYFKQAVMPAFRQFRKLVPEQVTAKQEARIQVELAKARRGEISYAEAYEFAAKTRGGVGIKEKFALTPEKLAARQAGAIADIEARVVSGDLSAKAGKMLITKLRKSPAFISRTIIPDFTSNQVGEVLQAQMMRERDIVRGFVEGLEAVGRGDINYQEFKPFIQRMKGEVDQYRAWVESRPELRGLELRMGDPGGAEGFWWETIGLDLEGLIKDIEAKDVFDISDLPRWRAMLANTDALIGSAALVRAGEMLFRYPPIPTGITLFDTTKVNALLSRIDSMAESGHVKVDAAQALKRLLLTGELPERHNLRDFAIAFGDEFAKTVGQLDSPNRTEQALDILNIPRAVIASWDLSATGRQGLILSLVHPTQVPKWFGRQVKALFSEKWALEIDDAMRADPLFRQFTSSGAYVAPLRGATFTTAEELFASRAARRIPGIKRSERAFATYLNQARFDTFKSAYNAMSAQGASEAHFKLLGEFLNIASGRGNIPASLERFMPFLNLTLFSPRLQAATLQLPRQLGRMLISDNPYMRKEGAKALITFAGGGAGLLALLRTTGAAEVETDPRSGDFGKIKIGETRLDIWRGYLQYTRLAAQMLTGERKSAYGNMNKAKRGEIAWRFIQSKASPAVGLLVDLLRGETYMGDPIFSDTTGFLKAAKEKVIPLAVQDIIDAMEQSGVNGVAIAAPALLGIGSLTYINDYIRAKEKIAREAGYDSWDDIDPKTQREIGNRNAELQAAEIAFDRQVMGTAWGDWRLAGKAIENVFRQNVENAVSKYRQDGEGVDFREKVSEAWSRRRGAFQAREGEDRFADIISRFKTQDTAEAMVNLGPEGVAIRLYNDALFGDDMFDEFGDYRYDEADRRKEQLRQTLGEDMFAYVEDYQGLRFETFPPEFQELTRAKELLRPYWQVKDEVIRLFGERYAEGNRGQALISKLRKRMRKGNPELEMAYQRFYVNTTD